MRRVGPCQTLRGGGHPRFPHSRFPPIDHNPLEFMPFPLRFTCPFVLASASPRRRALLDQLNVQFEATTSPADESITGSPSPPALVRRLSARKAAPVAKSRPSALVLAADTVVAHNDTVLEKPESPSHARRMLRRLSDTTHQVHTGIALHYASSDRRVATVNTTEVTLAPLSDAEISAYIDTGSPFDKAGGYGIQDHTAPLFVTGITGDYYTVVGLPLRVLYEHLHAHFGDLLMT